MRLFTAICLSDELKNALICAQSQLKGQIQAGNFTQPENLHITLAFLGETEKEKAAAEILEETDAAPFSLSLSGAGQFGSLWWVGVKENKALSTLAAGLHARFRGAGFALDARPFRPHITIARQVESNQNISLSIPRADMCVKQISLMQSQRIGGRLVYTQRFTKDLK